MKNKNNPSHFSSFRCDFDEESPNDRIMMEKLRNLRHITQFSNKQLLNFLLCLGDNATKDCQTFSDFLEMLPVSRKNHPPEAQPHAAQVTGYQITGVQHGAADPPEQTHHAAEQADTASAASPPDTTLDDLFQHNEDPETEEMIADILNL